MNKQERRDGEKIWRRVYQIDCAVNFTPTSRGNGFGEEGCLSFYQEFSEMVFKGNHLENVRYAPWSLGCTLGCQMQALGIASAEADSSSLRQQSTRVYLSSNCTRRGNVLPKCVHQFPRAIITHHHNIGCLKKQKFILSQFWKPEVQNLGVSRVVFPSKALRSTFLSSQ